MEKLKMHSPNVAEANIEKVAALFPSCVTESTDENGKLKMSIDFDLLRQELSTQLVEGPQERYRLDWPGKRKALLTANAPIAKTLRPCREESVDFDTTENLFIEGDNLDALKLLQETYLGKVKMIYIDPPYNTGKDFIYADNFAESTDEYLLDSGQKDVEGNRLVANTDSNGRFHSDWLSMMYSRLKLARNLLKDDGVIFISIDDNEVNNLRKICNDFFGEENVLGCVVSKRRGVPDNRNINRISPDHEYVLICGKSESKLNGTPKDLSKYKNPDNDPRGPWMSDNMTGLAAADLRPNLHYNLVNPLTRNTYPPHPGRGWAYESKRMDQLISEGRVIWPSKPDGRPRIKRYLNELNDSTTGFSTWQKLGYTTEGTRELTSLMGLKVFDFPKPISLGVTLCKQATDNVSNGIILDFFAGSGTIAHAVMQLNAEDGGKRKFIMIQLPETCDEKSEAFKASYKTIAEISKERIRRAGKKIKAENPITAPNLDTGFRVLKVDSSNMADVYYTPDAVKQSQLTLLTDNIREGRTSEDLLFQVLLDWGVDLTLPITIETIANREVFFVDSNALAACFAKNGQITEDFCKELAGRSPLRVVFRDSGFKDDSVKINVEQIFKLMSPHTEVKTI
ncbi:site-specific DNA-methyltransferase [Desulfogranum marinum]|uniref:site-specific DNA-methyltransferase n=1 Tax=Desulfogranum marinum TaxID=453220 RepID=UPI0029C85C6B|nr:site-specific DNA-methyltransferase [Desulfogranum marinum]